MKMDLDLLDYNDSLYYTIIKYGSSTFGANQFLDGLDIPYFVIKLSIGFMYIVSHYDIHKLPQTNIDLPQSRWDMSRYIPIEWSIHLNRTRGRAFVSHLGIDLKQLFRDWKIDLKDPSFHG